MQGDSLRIRFVARMLAVLCLSIVLPLATPTAHAQDDREAEAVFDAGHDALNRNAYREAARRFDEVAREHAESEYAGDALYWKAFALYRVGGRETLGEALGALERQREQYPDARTGEDDAPILMTRIEGELARLGDASSAERIVGKARDDDSDDPFDPELRMAALNALLQMDRDRALPLLHKILRNPESHPEEMRKKAVFLLADKGGEEADDLLLSVIRTDPSPEVRGDAVFWLGQSESDRAVDALEELLQTSDAPEVRKKAVFALAQVGDDRSMTILESLAVDGDAPLALREDAIFWIGQESHDASKVTGLYARLDDRELKEKVIFSAAQADDRDARAWLVGVASDPKEPIELRKSAFFWIWQDAEASEIAQVYEEIDDPEIRGQAVFALGQHGSDEAVEKLVEIATGDDAPELREKAVFWLGQSDSDRALEFLEQIIGSEGGR